jgi:hypothetical protein
MFLGALELVITASVLDVLRVEPGEEADYYQKVARTVVDIFLNGLGSQESR